MARREAIITAMVTVAVAVLAVTFAAGPKTDDWRYPQYIVDPRIKCASEGVFPHPRNCSWYYRCVDRMNIGFYYTYYFECEPGTVFDDDLDQCVFPHLTSPPCGTGTGVPPPPSTRPPPPPLTTPSTPPPPPPTTPPPPPPTTTPPPPPPPTTTPTPAPTTTTTSSIVPVRCVFHQSNCEVREYCQPDRVVRNLCTGCNIGSIIISTVDFCNGPNKVFDKDINTCVERPPDSALCPPSTSTTTTTTTTTTTPPPGGVPFQNNNTFTCSYSKPIPDEPWIRRTFCENYALCDAGQKFKGFKELCTNYYECSRTPQNTWTYSIKSCSEQGPDYYFSFQENQCVRLPQEERC